MKTLAAVVATALLAPAAARAQPVSHLSGPGPDTYLELHLGGFLPQEDDVDVLDPGFVVGGTFGARFDPHLSVEGGIEYLYASGEEGGAELTLWDLPISASVRLRLPMKVAELSALAGAALHVATLSFDGAPGGGDFADTSAAFGFHVGAAVAFNLSPTMTVGVDVRRTFVEASFEGASVKMGGFRLALALAYHL